MVAYGATFLLGVGYDMEYPFDLDMNVLAVVLRVVEREGMYHATLRGK